jgi:hypothetical protein
MARGNDMGMRAAQVEKSAATIEEWLLSGIRQLEIGEADAE